MAVRVPSFFAPIFTVIVFAGRLPTHGNECSRGSTAFTGRPVFLASRMAITVCLPSWSLQPKPPPM